MLVNFVQEAQEDLLFQQVNISIIQSLKGEDIFIY